MKLPEIDHAGQTAYSDKKFYVVLRSPETDELAWHEAEPKPLSAEQLESMKKESW